MKASVIALFFAMVVISFFPAMILAEDQTQEKKVSQQIDKKEKATSEDSVDIPHSQVLKEEPLDYGLLIQIIGITVGALLIIWQIGRQYKNNIELQRENNREKLKLEIYSDYRKTISNAQKKIISASAESQAIDGAFKFHFDQIQSSGSSFPMRPRAKNMQDVHFAATASLTDLVYLIEEFEIINPNLEIFRLAYSCAIHCLNKAFFPFHQELLEFLPCDVPLQDQARLGAEVLGPRKEVSREDLERISQRATLYNEEAWEASCYVSDLAKVAQNIFLGKLFSHTLPSRKPLDPKHIVLSIEPPKFQKLKKYFLEETEWGKEHKNAEKRVREELQERPTSLQ